MTYQFKHLMPRSYKENDPRQVADSFNNNNNIEKGYSQMCP